MILTEEQSRKTRCLKWVRDIDDFFANCIASRCMAWRWRDRVLMYPSDGRLVCIRPDTSGRDTEWAINFRRGYCGLVGELGMENQD